MDKGGEERSRKMPNVKKITILIFSVILMLSFVQVAFAGDAQKININTASSSELCKLKNVGPACADKIIKYREANGPFKKPEDLMNVKGVGPKTFEQIKDQITVQ